MKFLFLVWGAFALALVPAALPAQQAASEPSAAPARSASAASGAEVYKRMVALNAGLRSYQAKMHVDVSLKTFPFISPALDGNVYFKQPDHQAVIFDTIPALASAFRKVYPRIESPARWPEIYDTALSGDDGGVSTFRLVPKKNGRVDHLDVKVDDATGAINAYTWTYKDGGYITFSQTFMQVDGKYLVSAQVGHVELPNYRADVASRFSDYRLNVPLNDEMFTPQ